jgi:uncharacterized protein YbgA (DUF1722 family)/uncharacterized protein YbbK (DUF523 family)
MKTGRDNKIFIGVSSCLLGQKVRFDANHKEQRLLTQALAKEFKFVPICPEVAIGLGIPRTPIRLIGNKDNQRAVNVRDETIDVTDQLIAYGRKQANELNHISGYIFKKASPSCGLFNVKIYKSDNQVLHAGTGLFAKEITSANPLLPVEEEGRLNDKGLRNNFLQRVEIYHRWQQLIQEGLSRKALLNFHTQHKYTLLAHCEPTYRHLGRLLADIGNQDIHQCADNYIESLMNGLKEMATPGKHINVLEHIAGYFKQHLDSHDKSEFRQLISDYRSGALPRDTLVILLKHYLRKHPNRYLENQHYLTRNHYYGMSTQ